MSSIGERLREERQRLAMNQTELGVVAGVLKQAQIKYEKGERFPDAAYLAAAAAVGADIRYIVTGDRDAPPPEVLSADERVLLDRYRGSPQPLRDAALRVLLGGEVPSSAPIKKQVKVSAPGGNAAGRDMVVNSKPGKEKR
jgi:transcriptional regulator with XRE-family HTH domain